LQSQCPHYAGDECSLIGRHGIAQEVAQEGSIETRTQQSNGHGARLNRFRHTAQTLLCAHVLFQCFDGAVRAHVATAKHILKILQQLGLREQPAYQRHDLVLEPQRAVQHLFQIRAYTSFADLMFEGAERHKKAGQGSFQHGQEKRNTIVEVNIERAVGAPHLAGDFARSSAREPLGAKHALRRF